MHVLNSLGKGGLENGVVNVIDRLDPARFEHVVCTIRGLGVNADRLPTDRVPVLAIGPAGSTSRFQTLALVRAIRRFEPDVIHSRNWGAIEGVLAGRLTGCATVHSEHGLEAEAGSNEPKRRAYLRRLAFELADRVLSVSSQLRDLHAHRTGFPADRIAVVHNGVDLERFRRDPATRQRIRGEIGLADADFCIGCVANLLPVKDHLTLLEALTRLPAADDAWRLLLVGEGPERARLTSFIDARPWLGPRVLFLGSSNRVPELLQAMDAFVLPSVAEGICNSLLEAMATGVAPVATDVGGNPEVLVDGRSGFLFPVGDVVTLASHLARLRAEPRLRAEIGQQAIERVRDGFSIGSMVHAYEQLYTSVGPAGHPVMSAV
jgi:sugar transferase (PEP-CTERM/EpsH1 system associated)